MATKKIKVSYDAELCILEKGMYILYDDLFEFKSLKELKKAAQDIVKREYKHEYKNGRRFFLRNIERIEFRKINTAAKEIRVKL